MTAVLPSWLPEVAAGERHPLAFATVSGAHLYGFPSVDSDVDLRGVHVLPVEQVVGLRTGEETVTRSWIREGVEVDLVTHDLAKFCRLLLGRNGYVLEQLLSPLVVTTSPLHEEMRALAWGCLTRHHAHHYLGFARTQRRLFDRTGELKPLLYAFRVLLTGIHLMRTGELVADLTLLLDGGPPYLPGLIDAKRAAEHGGLPDDAPGGERLAADLDALTARLEDARDASALPDVPSAHDALHDLVVRTRLAGTPVGGPNW
ncbi:nucleotidyltransferase domain-containing protein [Microbispora bryophytorum]|uniref:Nucleotidyltransferase n=1 Tax=Microbispora bryophytorum TaxID=1460882 RepID=A0A8H9LAN1_9ACTN|nr:nucleotidyltransferase domain-containing protein [Microbispora bryophytorum]MBD3137086.1 nucleotidyltransferase domain-containing protein [Microbispora bryophytorum]TQS07331.1 nucleotidyltransferase domain-containing protein [Microbispora bryophytorum]GGO14389.1 nucleotidyltransferase [Microbispora bryophytorum]